MSSGNNISTSGQPSTVRQLFNNRVIRESQKVDNIKPNELLLDKVSVCRGDITVIDVDAIVNAANESLLGVDGAIHRAAGPELLKECRLLNGCDIGDAKITKGYKLPARHIIHTVGPVYHSEYEGTIAGQLASCYKRSLEVAVEKGLKSIAFPCISTGIFGYPNMKAAKIALTEIRRFLESDIGKQIEQVVFVVFLERDDKTYKELIPQIYPLTKTDVLAS
ncbi:hypothetical protein AGABI1DRAFT_114944 [Agaricus bisporus var. burnettii JB137-S8]|uniref:Macro domain-containing protein n=1 Tax=Agaricus bisporus var. burnettii (strain JB137-S8 / ATCC MYA-4627 / FGSC 10392) TaxID=597362 RepID=K5XT16_AGABU|nr:uncharacterized protein AGABI1DRAFT_114944 [Agaricus bisporus var. burnettii JB137-S8]EKM78125.1 hypothetical protein AGABI1DRAFT_114944 [Agaricus bisporus var. burnettii JB137-S8]